MGNIDRRRKKRPVLPFLLLSGLFMTLWLGLIIWVDPQVVANLMMEGAYLPFFLLMWLWTFFLLVGLSVPLARTLLWSGGVMVFLLLRLAGLGNVLNLLLLLGILVTYEYVNRLRNTDK